jgi:hypothetical protein
VLQRAGLVLCENDDLSCPLSKAFEQTLKSFLGRSANYGTGPVGSYRNACETRYVFVSDARQISSRIPLAGAE